MKLLHRLTMGKKFALTLLIPLLAITGLATVGVFERQAVSRDMARLERLMHLAEESGRLVHQLQRERGMSAGYLGSEGREFIAALAEQRQASDRAAEALVARLSALEPGLLGEQASTRLDEVRAGLADLGRYRQGVDALEPSADQAIRHYTAITSALIDGVGALGAGVEDGGLVRRLAAYTQLLNAKELAGIERAVLANAFAADRFTPALHRRFMSLVGEEAAYLSGFQRFATAAARDHYAEAMARPVVAEVAALRERAMAGAGQGGFGVEPGHWFERQTAKIDLLHDLETALSADLVAASQARYREARHALLAYLGLALLAWAVAIGLALLVSRSIVIPLRRTLAQIAAGEGDLSRRLEVLGSDELAALNRANNAATETTERLVASIQRGAASIHGASGEIAQGNQALAERTEEQSSSLVETASSMEQITVTVKQTADYAAQASRLTGEVDGQAREASRVAGEAREAMVAIKDANQRVTTIVEAIDAIAFQTNLLALNASVEAARAGEQGRGFAVVAGEVRQLAGRCAEEANQIRALVDASVLRTEEGERLVDDSAQRLDTITSGVGRVTHFVEEIAAAAGEQSAGIEQIHRAIAQLEAVTQHNASLVEQSAAATRALDDQAADLAARVGHFRVGKDLLAPSAAPVPPSPRRIGTPA
ncbi:nitrate- and nitrite sensing domain-containing protein [Halomonas salifodinae]|uniref:Nitrate- and nitrite sensing domain-containing protein n=1 Tax=Halomonas salifodinae TaxID=438745 RepID=A0ABW2ETR2_9GAMM